VIADANEDAVPAPPAQAAPSAHARLLQEPTRFSLDQAVAVLAPGVDPVEVPFRTVAHLGAPAGEVDIGKPTAPALHTPSFGLIGPGGVLPRHYTALVDTELRHRSVSLHAFMDLLSRRFTGLYVKAGSKYRTTRDPRHAQQVLAAAIGMGTPHLDATLASPLQALLHQAGGLASRTRSAERLRGMLTEETGHEVRIEEFAGTWMRLPPSEQTRLLPGGRHSRLGVDASLGVQVWDPSARFVVSLGPLSLATFRSLLPGTRRFKRLVELTRLQAGLEQEFVLNPVLAAEEVPALRLAGGADDSGGRLGWTSWLNAPHARRKPAADAQLNPYSAL
jgi:type VI secretion system protein ImpH